MVSATDGWACGWGPTDARSFRWNDTAWTEVTYPSGRACQELSVVAADDVWAVGTGGTIAHFGGTSWVTVTSPVTYNLYALDMVAADDGWAVGANGTILNYDGTNWTIASSPTSELLSAIDMVSASDGWAGGTELLHYTGSSWVTNTTPVALGEDGRILDIDMVSSTEGWAVGEWGLIWHFTDGGGGYDWIWERLYVPLAVSNFLVRR